MVTHASSNRALVVLLLLIVTACGATHLGPANGPAAGSLESELSSLPPASDGPSAIRRSRLLRALGRHDEAIAGLEIGVDVERQNLRWPSLMALWREIGDVHVERGRAQDALEAFGKRLKIAGAIEDRSARGHALVDTAYAFALMGAMGRADEALSEAAMLGEDELLQDPDTAERMALTWVRLHDVDRAAQVLPRAEKGFVAKGDATGRARVAVYAAALSSRTQRTAAPLDAVANVLASSRDSAPRIKWLRYRAEAAFRDGDAARCQKLASESVELADRRALQPEAKNARVTLARCAAENRQLDVAIRSTEEAGFLAEEQLQHLSGDQARQETGFEVFQIFRLLFSLQVEKAGGNATGEAVQAAFAASERARARAHLDAVARSQAVLHGPISEVSPLLLRSRAEAEERVRRLTRSLAVRRKDPNLKERHRNALWALEDIKETIRQQNPLLLRIQVPQPASVSDVRANLLKVDMTSGTGDAPILVSYFMGEDHPAAIAITPNDARLVTLTGGLEDLDKQTRKFRERYLLRPTKSLSSTRAAGAKLYARLLAPFQDLLDKHRQLIVVPHGSLSSLPFEALVDGNGKFLVETHDVGYAISATLGVEMARRQPGRGARRAFVGLGDPVYDWAAFQKQTQEGSSPVASRGLELWTEAESLALGPSGKTKPRGLPRLPGTATEVRAIAKLFGADKQVYLREKASEETVKTGALKNTRIVHIASHGILEPHYQGLALTLNPDSKEDGFLLHSEIVDLELNADLVVLSACQTGNTQLRSAEPVAGLALALRSAGARNVVVSLWSVDDEATVKLMTDFYGPLVKEGQKYRRSLSEAKRTMLSRGLKHPYFWAPFVLFGAP